MMAHDRPSQNDYDVYESILSSNYTRPVETFGSSEHDADFINIYGRLGGEIVFGIDGIGRMGSSEILPFTKTYRLMAMDLPDMGSVIHIPSGNNLDRGTQVIKFYGHSLGKADYSYFQAIFDAVNLYESSTSLVFFFRPHKNPTGEMGSVDKARKDMMAKAIALLTTYGETLDNKDHGANLIHKLLKEGRLAVTLLPNTVRKAS